jgi:hypothetical protein
MNLDGPCFLFTRRQFFRGFRDLAVNNIVICVLIFLGNVHTNAFKLDIVRHQEFRQGLTVAGLLFRLFQTVELEHFFNRSKPSLGRGAGLSTVRR